MDIKHIMLKKKKNIIFFNSIKAELLKADLLNPSPDERVMEELFRRWKDGK